MIQRLMQKVSLLLIALIALPVAAQDEPAWINVPALEARDVSPDPVNASTAWLAGNGGLFRYDGSSGKWQVLTTADGLSTSWITSVHAEGTRVWAGTERNGVNVLDRRDGRITSALQDYGDDGGVTVRDVVTAEKEAWLATDHGVLRLDVGSLQLTGAWDRRGGAGDNDVFALASTEEHIWAATAFGGAFVTDTEVNYPDTGGLTRIARDGSSIHNFQLPERGTSHFSSVAAEGKEVWVGGVAGLLRFDPDEEAFSAVDGVAGSIRSILIDGDFVWCTAVSEREEFLYRIDRATGDVLWSHVLPNHFVSAQLARVGGEIVISKGAYVLVMAPQASQWRTLDDPYLPEPFTQGIDGDGDALFIGSRNYLVELDAESGEIRRSRAIADDASFAIRSIAVGEDEVWIGTDHGLWQLSRDDLQVEETHLEEQAIRQIRITPHEVWVIHNQRVSVIDTATGSMATLEFAEYLGANSEPAIYDVILDEQHAWLGYGVSGEVGSASGIIQIDRAGKTFIASRRVDDELSTAARTLADAGPELFAGGDRIRRIDKSSLEPTVFADAPARRLAVTGDRVWAVFGSPLDGGVRAYSRDDGRLEAELRERNGLLRDYVTDLHPTHDGRMVWFTTSEGASGIRTSNLPELDAESLPAPVATAIESVFPNPTSGAQTITFNFDRSTEATLRLYDARGGLAGEWAFGLVAAGRMKFRYDASHLAAGIYFWRLNSQNLVETASLVIVR